MTYRDDESEALIFLVGFLIGFIAAIPIGPLNIFAVSQTLRHNFLHGLLAGLTASLLDIFYCFIAITGMTQVFSILSRIESPLKIIGAGILIGISVRLLTHRKSLENPQPYKSLSGAYSKPVFVSFLLYTSNPTIYAFWLAVAGIVAAHGWLRAGFWQPAIFALCCGVGSSVWYFILIRYVFKNKKFFRAKTFSYILTGLSIVLLSFAAFSLATLFFR